MDTVIGLIGLIVLIVLIGLVKAAIGRVVDQAAAGVDILAEGVANAIRSEEDPGDSKFVGDDSWDD